MQEYLLYFSLYFVFYIMGAYATTDILRLLKGSTITVNAPDCYCPICHNKISLRDQLPIISYIKNDKKCFHCKSPIPISDLFLEVFLFLTLSITCTCLNFSWYAYFLCIVIYEGTKIAFLVYYGPRQDSFQKNLFISIKNNIVIFTLVAFLFLIMQIV